MKDKKDITLKLNKKEVELIKKVLDNHSLHLRHNVYLHEVGQYKETLLSFESLVNSLYNVESIQNKIKKEGV